MFNLIAALIDGSPTSAHDRALVNDAAAGARPRLELDGRRRVRRHGALAAALAELATDVLDLFDSPDRELLHWCADGRCTRPFIDRSRGQRRRWCGMAGCGDRSKAAAYRQRLRTVQSAD
jgi:predicted RNA-binding Zn ribbon-like protein